MSDVLDLRPLLKRRAQQSCTHPYVLVDEDLPTLTCDDCGKDIDPLWWIRRLTEDFSQWTTAVAELEAEYKKRHATLTAQLQHHRDELNRVIDTKERLLREEVNGMRVRDAVRYTRKRSS